MKIAFFSSHRYEQDVFDALNKHYQHEITYFEQSLSPKTALLAQGAKAVCVFVNDVVQAETLQLLKQFGVQIIALRCAGYNNVDLPTALQLGLPAVRVPAYSPYSVAEHTVGLMLTLNRKIHRAYNRVKESNFSLDGLLGFDFHGLTVGIIGTGKIGELVARIMHGFGCTLKAFDVQKNKACEDMGVTYVELDELFATSDVVTLHCPLTPQTFHIINPDTIAKMKEGVMLINTSRGALIDTKAVIEGLKSRKIGYLGLDVYEEEGDLFFQDLSDKVIQDDVFMRLLTFPNVLITGHQAFFTQNALNNIAETTLQNLADFEAGKALKNEVKPL
jgi:D-lactate dehydrogenase